MTITIIDCGAGNLHSVRKAFAAVAPEHTITVTQDAAMLRDASHIVLPGVGAFADCMGGLNALPGMRDALECEVLGARKPFFGICVGMQMLFTRSHEHGMHAGLGWLAGEVVQLAPNNPALPVPHMGWNKLCPMQAASARRYGISADSYAYFVHSFHAVNVDAADILATVDYGGSLVAMVARENIVATQFHPEKSQATGLTMLQHFVQQKGAA
jgi:glutamine amidotransferase